MAILTLLCVAAIVVGFIDDCDDDMRTWLLVYGFTGLVVAATMCLIFCFLVPFLAAGFDTSAKVGPFPILCCILPLVAVVIFPFGWWIYGCVLFWPKVFEMIGVAIAADEEVTAESPCWLQIIAGGVITILSIFAAAIDSCISCRKHRNKSNLDEMDMDI